MAEMGGFGSIGCYINAGFHPFNPNFRKVDSIYISEDNKTLMINTLSSTVFLRLKITQRRIDHESNRG